MGVFGTPCSGFQQARTTETPQQPRRPQRCLLRTLRTKERLCLAAFAPRLRTPWETVYWWFRRWRIDGTFERLNAELREVLRVRSGRNPLPRAQVSPTPRGGKD